MRGKRFVRPILLKYYFSSFDNLSSLLEKTLQWKVHGEIALKWGRATSCDTEIISVYAMNTSTTNVTLIQNALSRRHILHYLQDFSRESYLTVMLAKFIAQIDLVLWTESFSPPKWFEWQITSNQWFVYDACHTSLDPKFLRPDSNFSLLEIYVVFLRE